MSILLAIALAAAGAAPGAVPGEASAKTGRVARITSASVSYDRKEGFAYFSGRVHVDDEKYQLHADRAYVFMGATNDLERIVALGHVAMTNGEKRAYGAKASYYRNPGMFVLSSGDGTVAEVRETGAQGDRVVRGKKIKFWTESRQVEVLEAEITAPTQGAADGVKGILGK